MFSKVKQILPFIILGIFLFFLLISYVNSQLPEQTKNVMKGINVKREELGLKQLQIDENLCLLAKRIAEDSERYYPDEFTGSFYGSPDYVDYVKDYETYNANKLTLSEKMVEKANGNKEQLTMTDDFLINGFTVQDETHLFVDALRPEYEYGCIGVSSGKIGHKPFAYFIGGIKKKGSNKGINDYIFDVVNRIASLLN